MALVQFPTAFPMEAVPVLAQYLRKQVSAKDAGNAAWNVVGWAGGSWLPGNDVLAPQMQAAQITSDEDAAKQLEEAYQKAKATPPGDAQAGLFGGGGVFGPVIVGILTKVATRVLEEWLKKFTGGAPQQGQPIPASPK